MAEHRPGLWLIRHGETEWTATGQHTGRTDIPLTALGRRQATALGRRLADRVFDLVLVSPLTRAMETCRIAGFGDGAKPTDDLREWDYGAYEGRTTADIRTEVPGWTIWTHGLPGGETIEQVAERVGSVIGQATAAGGDVALFAHGHVLRVLAACWLSLPPEAGRLLGLGTASLSVLGYERETRIITTWNQDWHLVRKEDP